MKVMISLFNNARADDCTGLASMIAYSFFLALPVALIFIVSVLGALPGIDITGSLVGQLEDVLPGEMVELIDETVSDALSGGESILIISLIGTIYVLNNGYAGLITSINRIYGLKENRSWLAVRLRAFILSVFITVLLTATATFLLAAPKVVDYFADSGSAQTFASLLDWMRWPAIIVLGILAVESTYKFAPCGGPRWRLFSPGSLFATAFWVAATLGFGAYVDNFSSYDVVYGTLAAVVIMLVWLWMSALIFLIGAEINKVWRERRLVRTDREARDTAATETTPPAKEGAPNLAEPHIDV